MSGVDAETRATQLENALRAILDEHATYGADPGVAIPSGLEDAIDEARALLDGEGVPADTEDDDA